eukprot:CAMPEP_0115165784 /NCGR_PEP_ID=MMETSP0227-20121206/73781_1 /TAXON_ID=89957 /ORGANISM="Polarella glacialis, Strain CCMP 1383" /LENGTH=173 /DNA_ID=CAMNT_0002578287 /DNA_START=1 /DNA_END=520 /DNA_ORIENTATION=-
MTCPFPGGRLRGRAHDQMLRDKLWLCGCEALNDLHHFAHEEVATKNPDLNRIRSRVLLGLEGLLEKFMSASSWVALVTVVVERVVVELVCVDVLLVVEVFVEVVVFVMVVVVVEVKVVVCVEDEVVVLVEVLVVVELLEVDVVVLIAVELLVVVELPVRVEVALVDVTLVDVT